MLAMDNSGNNSNIIICIGRQLGSGGHIIAKKLAETFGCKFYDRELLNLAAKESGFSPQFFERNDEHKGFFQSLFNCGTRFYSEASYYNSDISQEGLFKFQSDAIRHAAEQGSCVFVGRCADYVLRDMPNMVSVFITANIGERIARVKERNAADDTAALKMIEDGDKQRSSYYNYYTGKRWGDSSSYDLCVNSSLLGIDKTTRFVTDYIREAYHMKASE